MGWRTDNFRPYGARCVVRLDPQVGEHSGIIIPDEWQRQQQTGTVVSVGPGYVDNDGERWHALYEPGQRVIFGKWNGKPLADPDDDYSGLPTTRYFLMERACHKHMTHAIDDIYGVIEDAAPGAVNEWKVSA